MKTHTSLYPRIVRLFLLVVLLASLASCTSACEAIASIFSSFQSMLSALVLTPLIGLVSGGIQAAADPGLAVPGSTVTHYLQYTADPAGQTADLLWTPPPGGSNFAFSQTPAPGGPPFRFPTVLDQTVITVSYTLPQLPPGVSSWTVAESLAVLPAGMEGNPPTAVLYTLISEAAQTAASLDAPSPHHQPTAPGMIDVWRAELWVDILGQPLETATCEEWLAFLQNETTFMALRLPVPPGAPGSIPLPFVYGDAGGAAPHATPYAWSNMPLVCPPSSAARSVTRPTAPRC